MLIVEDERPAVAKLRAGLAAIDAEVDVVGVCDSVRSGAAWLADHPHPDLILAGIQLGDGTSFELLAQAPARSPVVFVTAYDAHLIEAFSAGGIDYLLKPVRNDRLAAAIDKYVRLERTAGPRAAGGRGGAAPGTASGWWCARAGQAVDRCVSSRRG
ncbi:MAG: response regulator [Myxococcota bacterium]